ncbi:MAG: AMP-binding protein [Bacteroidota bacterium]
MKYLRSDTEPGELIANIALMLQRNAMRFADRPVCCIKKNGVYEGAAWSAFYERILSIAAGLKEIGFGKGDKMIVYSTNRPEMLELELAIMASGGISVPIFAFFPKETVTLLVRHSDARFLAAEGALQLDRVDSALPLEKILVFDPCPDSIHHELISFSSLQKTKSTQPIPLNFDASTDEICLNMYTSGTMGVPKCVQLSHRNILSQQAGLERIWGINTNDRFLSYLPWHHSFGGIFERFSALYNGAAIYLDSGCGKDPAELLANWKLARPTVFFSVPKIYGALIEQLKYDPTLEAGIFHPGLRFVFTAAAALPPAISQEFDRRGIPVMEGWGLTETSPCCTITDPNIKREAGVVGKPIPGVEIRIAEDGEIQVKGPNVMKGYYKNDEANRNSFTADGWFCTGDLGEITPGGLKLRARKDRVFKLTNGEKVMPAEIEELIQSKCHYLTYALVIGGGREYTVALLFPNKKALDHPNYELSPDEGCFCPRSLSELKKCLHGCLKDANCGLGNKFSRIKYAMLIDDELSIEGSTLTPSMKIAPARIMNTYKAHIENLYGQENKLSHEVYIIRLEPDQGTVQNQKKATCMK